MGRKKRKDSNKYNYSYKRSNTNQPKLNWAFLHDTALFIWFDHEQKKKKKKEGRVSSGMNWMPNVLMMMIKNRLVLLLMRVK